MYSCPPMPPVPCPPDCPPSKRNDEQSKYYREIGTEMIGNRLIIRMEREKGKSRKLKDWDPPCDCDVVIQRPSEKEGPKILKVADNNQILFRVQSRSILSRKDGDTMPQAVSYEVGQCRGGPNTNDQCRTITIYPVADSSGAQQVHTDRLTLGDENVFLLKVKSKPDSEEIPKKNIELEMRTPKPPDLCVPPTPASSVAKLPESEKDVPAVEEDCFKAAAPKRRLKKRSKKKKKRR